VATVDSNVATVDSNVSVSHICGIASYNFEIQHTARGLVDVKSPKVRMGVSRYIYSKKILKSE
jgi:hypothetical protein